MDSPGDSRALPSSTPGTPASTEDTRTSRGGIIAPGSADLGPGSADLHGLYGPRSQAWRLNREATLLLGAGPRALLMQIAHPLIAEGVAQHSTFRADPWRRLRTTLRSYLAIVYGTGTEARAEIRRLNRLHRGVRGHVADAEARRATGRAAYDARDPALALWVHATLVDATLVANDAWIRPLGRESRSAYYRETVPIGRAFGIPASILPPDIDAFQGYLDEQLGPGGPVRVTPTARVLAQAILHPTLAPFHPALASVPPAAYAWTLWPSIGLLPPAIRRAYALPWGIREQAVAGWLVAGFRAWRPLVPPGWRWMPQARAATARLTGLA